jgi:hypothetical protein
MDKFTSCMDQQKFHSKTEKLVHSLGKINNWHSTFPEIKLGIQHSQEVVSLNKCK